MWHIRMVSSFFSPVVSEYASCIYVAYQDGKFVLFTPIVSEYASCIYVTYQDVSSFFSPVVSEYASCIYIYILIPLR